MIGNYKQPGPAPIKPFGYFYGNKGRRKTRMLFTDAATCCMYAAADRRSGFRVRMFDRTPKPEPIYSVCW